MADLVTVTGDVIDHDRGVPLVGVIVRAYPHQRTTRTADGEIAVTDAETTTDESGNFSLELVWAVGLRYRIVFEIETSFRKSQEYTIGTLDCDSWPAGSTVTIADLPPIAGVPPSAVEDLQAWLLARLAEGMSPETIEAAVIAYLDENPVGIPAHNDTTLRDAADAHPMTSITGLVAALAGKQAAGDYATAAQGAKADAAIPSGLVDAKGDLIVATADNTATRLPAGTNGHVLTADSAESAGVKWAAPAGGSTAFELRGTGMPNGVVTASPGTYYTDEAGTNGAWRWLKKTGTGNTGWECIVGDTGVRNVASLHTDSTFHTSWATITISRAGNIVTIAMEVYTRASYSGVGMVIPIPLGFQIDNFYTHALAVSDESQGRSWITASGGDLWLQGPPGDHDGWSTAGAIIGRTSDPWPTTLPGVPG